MNKTELVAAVADKSGLSKAAAQGAVDAVFSTVAEALVKRDSVVIIGFGTFSTRARAARTAKKIGDPSQTIQIPAATLPVFKAGRKLKDDVNG